MDPTEPAPPDRRPDPQDVFGAYVRGRELGRGGFGAVYLAHDTRLRRPAALKLLRSDDPEDLARFEREAMLAAGLSHPNIAAVYDVGRDHGQMYLAMQFIDGDTAGRRPLDVPRAVAVIRDAARAVHYAHQQGVIHRDLKPDNLMIDRQGRVFVMDFGLAKRLSADSSISLTGTVLGTPAYMPPEQARGEVRLDARADVYALGATLHHLLAGRRPFDAESPYEMLRMVMEEEPADAGSDVPAELKLIVRKAMEKEAARRYATADALADDLQRFLNGETIAAKPPTPAYRLRKSIGRNPWAWALGGAAAAIALAAAAALGVGGLMLGRERDRVIEEMRTVTDLQLALALEKRRVGKLDEMRALLPHVEAACDRVIERAPELAEPHYRKGRMYQAMMMDSRALQEMNAAVRLDPAYAPARFERGLMRYQAYSEARAEALRRWWAQEAGRRIDPATGAVPAGQRFRDPTFGELASVHPELRRLRDEAVEDLNAAGDRPTALGLLAMIEFDKPEAVRQLKIALEQDPYQEAATIWLTDMEGSDEWLKRAIDRDRGYVPYYRARARIRSAEAVRAHADGRLDAALEGVSDAFGDCETAIRFDATNADLWRDRAWFREQRGTILMMTGGDPDPDFRAAIEDLDRAFALRPDALDTLLARARLRSKWAVHRAGRGGIVDEEFQAAVDDLGDALERDPSRLDIWHERGLMRTNWADLARERGDDPTPFYEAAIADMNEAIRIKPAWFSPWDGRGWAQAQYAFHIQRRGLDPRPPLNAAIADFDQALSLKPDNAPVLMRRGLARNILALDAHRRGEDPSAVYERAIADLTAAVELDPGADDAWACLGDAWVNWGVYAMIERVDPSERFRLGTEAHQRALDINAGRADTYVSLGNALMAWGTWTQHRGGPGAATIERGIEKLDAALALNPMHAEAHWRRGQCRQLLSRWQDALDDYERALELNPAMQAQIGPSVEKCRSKLPPSDF